MTWRRFFDHASLAFFVMAVAYMVLAVGLDQGFLMLTAIGCGVLSVLCGAFGRAIRVRR